MRLWLLVSLAIAGWGVVAAMILFVFPLRSFLRRYPILRDESDMAAFKRIATTQMYAALVGLYLTWVPLVIWLVGKFVLGVLTWWDGLFFVFLPFVAQVFFPSIGIKTAEAVRATPAATASLTAERDHVVDVWLHKMFPDW